jgi:hypothetical protein
MELPRGVSQTPLVGKQFAGVDAQQGVVGLGIVGVDIVNVVCGHKGQVQFVGQLNQHGPNDPLVVYAVVLYLDVKAFRAEHLAVSSRDILGAAHVFAEESPADFALETAGKSDESAAVLGQNFVVDSRFIIEAFEVSGGGEFQEVLVSLAVAHEEREVVTCFLVRPAAAVVPAFMCHIRLVAYDGLYAMLERFRVELDCAEEIPVVGDGNGACALPAGLFHKLLNLACAVEKTVFAMNMKVDKRCRRHDIPRTKVMDS